MSTQTRLYKTFINLCLKIKEKSNFPKSQFGTKFECRFYLYILGCISTTKIFIFFYWTVISELGESHQRICCSPGSLA
jgi:hypothetical protein